MSCWRWIAAGCGRKALPNLLQAAAAREAAKHPQGSRGCAPGYPEDDALRSRFSSVSAGTVFHGLCLSSLLLGLQLAKGLTLPAQVAEG